MKILGFFDKQIINIDLLSQNKKQVLDELSLPISQITNIKHDEIVRVLLERERLGTTGIGNGVGIPHGKIKNLKKLTISFGISKKGINFEAIDGLLTHIFFLILAPEDSIAFHINLLSHLSKLLRDDLFREKLILATSSDQIISIIKEKNSEFE